MKNLPEQNKYQARVENYLYAKEARQKYYNRFQLVLRKTETDYKELYKEKWEYYTGKSSDEVYKENPFDIQLKELSLSAANERFLNHPVVK